MKQPIVLCILDGMGINENKNNILSDTYCVGVELIENFKQNKAIFMWLDVL